MATHTHYLYQIFTLYQALPRQADKAISIKELLQKPSIAQAFAKQNESISDNAQEKKLIRCLDELGDILHQQLIKQTVGKKNMYHLTSSASFEPMDADTAMLLVLAESFLRVIAPTLLESRHGVFDKAYQQIAKSHQLQNWQKRLYFTLDELEQYPQFAVDNKVETVVFQALRENSPLKIDYIKTGSTKIKEHKGYPLKLVVTPHQRLLILDSEQWNDTVTFALHRIVTAEIMDGLDVPDDMQLDVAQIEQNIERHTQVMWRVKPIDLVVSVPVALQHLISENPLLIKYQPVAISTKDDYQQFKLSQVLVTRAVMDFFVANAKNVWVSEPEWLQDDIINQLQAGLEHYGFEI